MDPLDAAAFDRVLDRRLEVDVARPLAVALSGGGDSAALLALTLDWARPRGRPVLALIVDHRLHPDSAGWSRSAADLATGLGAAVRVRVWPGDKPATGLPAAARRARHAALAEAARAAGARVILLGHTLDDHWETETMRAQGAPVGRLWQWAPSPAWPEGRGVFLLRPLLRTLRSTLRDRLRARGLPWHEDPANADLRFARVRVRAALAPLSPRAPPPWTMFDRAPCPGLSTLDFAHDGRILAMRADDPGQAWAKRLVRAALDAASGRDRPVRRDRLEALVARLHDPGRAPWTATLGGARIVAALHEIGFGRDPGRAGLAALAVAPGATVVWDGRFEIDVDAPGEIRALAGRAAALSRADRAALRDSPAWVRPTLPLFLGASGAPALPRSRPLAPDRVRAALGAIQHESDLA